MNSLLETVQGAKSQAVRARWLREGKKGLEAIQNGWRAKEYVPTNRQTDLPQIFAMPVEDIQIDPEQVMTDLERDVALALEKGRILLKAYDDSQQEARQAFPADGIQRLRALSVNGISEEWWRSHPLFDVPTGLKELEALRASDPLAYARALSSAKETEASLESLAKRLMEAKTRADEAMQAYEKEEVAFERTVLSEKEDPRGKAEVGRKFMDVLSTALGAGTSLEQVELASGRTVEEYRAALLLKAEVKKAIAHAEDKVRQATEESRVVAASLTEARKLLEEMAKIHPAGLLHASRETLARAEASFETQKGTINNAEQTLKEKKHLEAMRQAEASLQGLGEVRQLHQMMVSTVKKLEQERQAYQEKLAAVQARQAALETRLAGAGRGLDTFTAHSTNITNIQVSDNMNWVMALLLLDEADRGFDHVEHSFAEPSDSNDQDDSSDGYGSTDSDTDSGGSSWDSGGSGGGYDGGGSDSGGSSW